MNKTEFLKDLDRRLRGIPKEDREDALRYYEELIVDMEITDDEDVTARLGQSKDVAKGIIDETTVKYAEEVAESKKVKGSGTVIWLTIFGILSAPVSLPLAICMFAVVLVLVIALFVVYISLFATALCMVLAGIYVFGAAFFVPGFMSKVAWSGVGLFSAGLGILLGYGMIALMRLIVKAIAGRKNKKEKRDE